MDTTPAAAAPPDDARPRHTPDPARPDAPQLRTLLMTDLVDSTMLVERLGDGPAAELFRAHDRIVLRLQEQWRGRLIDRSDGLLLLFERPIDGLGFALDYARGLRDLGLSRGFDLKARAGLHVGEVLTWRNSDAAVRVGAKPLEVEGLAKPMAGRLMSMARPGQILLSAIAEPLAHRAARELGERGDLLLWKAHGRWRFKGVPQVQEIFEVGEVGIAPLRAPLTSNKAWRDIPLWRRPAALAAEAALLAVVAVGTWFALKPQPAIAFGERDWVVVGDLRNLTGQSALDESLEQAFRISLEQSQYVNLISDLKVRETLQRMQRKPDAQVDRALGSEIALRDGARALILPTVAEVGGQLRVSVEVIDPRTQTTVHAISADGRGVESVLASIDDVVGGLRTTLGEALQSVEKNSAPLQQATTSNLEALKAFSLARVEIETRGDMEAAMGLLDRALQLDPQFALAHANKGIVYWAVLGQASEAKASWQRALAIPDRLTAQERLRVEARLLQLGPPARLLPALRRYLTLYSDDFAARGQLANNEWQLLNDFRAAEVSVRGMISDKYPRLGSGHYLHGISLLGQERHVEAREAFAASRQQGFFLFGDLLARAHQSTRKHAEADRAYAQSTAGKKGWDGEAAVVTYIDRARWADAEAAARDWLVQAQAGSDAEEVLRAQAALATVQVLSPQARRGDAPRALAAAAADPKVGGAAAAVRPYTSVETTLLAALLAARQEDAAQVRTLLGVVAGDAALRDYPTIAQLHQVVMAEQERLAGDPKAAVRRLGPLARRHDALVLVHWALMRAARADGNVRLASAQAKWLATHRGRAFTEATTTNILRFANIETTNAALLELAELAAEGGDRDDAARQLAAYLAAVPEAGLGPVERGRLQQLRRALEVPTS